MRMVSGMTVQPIGFTPEWTLGDRLRKARKQTGMTQRAFADAIGEEHSRYSQWEADNNRPRHLVEVCQSIESISGVSAAWILGLVTDPRGNPQGLQRGYALDDGGGPKVPVRGDMVVALAA